MRERSEIRILKLDAEIEEATGFHFQFDERERIVSEDNNFRRIDNFVTASAGTESWLDVVRLTVDLRGEQPEKA